MKALVIAADASLAEVLSRAFRSRGVPMDASVSGDDRALPSRHGEYDLVVVDAELLEVDPVTIVREVRLTDARVPILVVGARDRGCTVAEALTAGADDYLVRPVDVEELVVRLHALGRRADGWPSKHSRG